MEHPDEHNAPRSAPAALDDAALEAVAAGGDLFPRDKDLYPEYGVPGRDLSELDWTDDPPSPARSDEYWYERYGLAGRSNPPGELHDDLPQPSLPVPSLLPHFPL